VFLIEIPLHKNNTNTCDTINICSGQPL